MKPTNNNTTQIPHNKQYKIIQKGDRVRCRNYQLGNNWVFGEIKKRVGKLHYIILLDDGRIRKHHINQIRLIREQLPSRMSISVENRYANNNSNEQDGIELQRRCDIEAHRQVNIPELRR